MLTFFGEQSLKDGLIRRLEQHYEMDEFINGTYWEDGKGCAVGCAVHSDNHMDFERLYGIDAQFAFMQEHIFESLYKIAPSQAKEWPLQFTRAIPVGVDLSCVWPTFLHWLLIDAEDGVIRFAHHRIECEEVTCTVAVLLAKRMQGYSVPPYEFEKAAQAAEKAAEKAAWAAARAAARAAGRGAEWAAARAAGWGAEWGAEWAAEWGAEWGAEWAAARAAGAAERAAGWGAEWGAEWAAPARAAMAAAGAEESTEAQAAATERQRDKLLSLLKSCEVQHSDNREISEAGQVITHTLTKGATHEFNCQSKQRRFCGTRRGATASGLL